MVRLDPRINVSQGDGSISTIGLNNRYNNISVEACPSAIRSASTRTACPYQSTPISSDTIAEYNISTANFDVSSDAVGADINAVTKSGTNDFHGSVYYTYRNGRKWSVTRASWIPGPRDTL